MDKPTYDLRTTVARLIYDILEGPVNNQDFGRQTRQWEMSLSLADAAIAAYRAHPDGAAADQTEVQEWREAVNIWQNRWHDEKTRTEKAEAERDAALENLTLTNEGWHRAMDERDKVVEALREVMSWIDGWDPNFIHDDEWPATKRKITEVLGASHE